MKKTQFAICLSLSFIVACSGCSRNLSQSAPKEATPQPPQYFHVDPATAAEIAGKVSYIGPKPTPKKIDMSEDPACVSAHHGQAFDESLIVGRNHSLANAFIYIKSGLEGKTFEVPATPVVIDQNGCWFHPHVMGVQTNQVVKIVNSDPVTHNIHPMAEVNREWNHSQGPGDPVLTRKFVKPEIMIPVKCNIHSWMRAYIGVLDHPYFAVSKDDGTFKIPNLPPGTYTLAIWQEKLGTQEQQITIAPGQHAVADFTFKGK
ncbi:MAG: carboxypeptidase regulatory-like domain-containing protein [Acidobacteria bacterium]|nr:carboxypeptidase regulatory-like domain-containing protein [Acidobacteriota bacterium]